MADASTEKAGIQPDLVRSESDHEATKPLVDDEFEVFKKTGHGVDFRTVTWPRASIIFLKILFATGVLSIPAAMYSLGAAPGALLIVGFGALNTYVGRVQGDFRNTHPGCHSVADMAQYLGGVPLKELVGGLFVVAYVLCAGSGILGVSVALNALSENAICTVWFSFIATLMTAIAASVRTFSNIGWVSWAGFVSIYVAVFIVVVGVTTRDRPAAAPPTGDYDLGYHAVAHPAFEAGITSTLTIFISSAGTSAFIPVIAEMRRPQDFRRSLYICMGFVTASYLAFASVVYAWCGQWVASPALGSAGNMVKKVSYGIGFIGLIVSACLYTHVAAKYVFVRILRNSRHLQENTMVHWGTWLGCTFGLSAISFVLASAIPIYNYLIALTASVCFAPLALVLPGWLWLYDHNSYRKQGIVKKTVWGLHWVLIAIGVLLCVGGTYGVCKLIQAAYADNLVGSAFSCADNSGTVGV